MKTVGILTMHKVLNYGSALQAWATQEVIRKLGYDAYLIDYIYPNDYHKSFHKREVIKDVIRYCLHLYLGFPLKKKKKAFEIFWDNHFRLSPCYRSRNEIKCKPPQYDIYVAGSDQIWNPSHIHEDSTFFFVFVPQGKKKVSYASSFAQSEINGTFESLAKKYLSDFVSISVREKNGANIVKQLLNRHAEICLDPTLLLAKEDYQVLAKESKLNIPQPYMLVYILQYAYNPYPYATQFIQEAYRQTKLQVVCLDFSAKQHLNIPNVIYLHDAVGPNEFVSLFMNASLVITTSFHGTAFALNFGVSVYSIVNNKSTSDDRMRSLLSLCGMAERAVVMGNKHITINLDAITQIQNNIKMMREKSIYFLEKELDNI